MRKRYEKSELSFFFLWLMVYLLAQNIGFMLSQRVGVECSVTAVLNLGLAVFLYFWIRKQGLLEYYGLCRIKVPLRSMLWFLPLLLISSQNLWNGIELKMSLAELAAYMVTMACVGFLEEILMRGFLFQYLKRASVGLAVAVSAVSFGAGHMINLFSAGGMGLEDTLIQIAAALCFGLLCAVLLLRSGSLWPCILSHSAINMLSAFLREENLTLSRKLLLSGSNMLLMLLYLGFLLWTREKKT